MARRIAVVTLVGLAWAMWLGCANITINVVFPDAAVDQRIDQIEDEVDEGAGLEEGGTLEDGLEADPLPESGAWQPSLFDSLLGITPAYAGEGSLTAQEKEITARRKARAGRLEEWKNKGAVGEGRDGLLVVRSVGDLSAKDKGALHKLVKMENKDRKVLFPLIASNEGTDDVAGVAKRFAKKRAERAKKGQWVQKVDGTWAQK